MARAAGRRRRRAPRHRRVVRGRRGWRVREKRLLFAAHCSRRQHFVSERTAQSDRSAESNKCRGRTAIRRFPRAKRRRASVRCHRRCRRAVLLQSRHASQSQQSAPAARKRASLCTHDPLARGGDSKVGHGSARPGRQPAFGEDGEIGAAAGKRMGKLLPPHVWCALAGRCAEPCAAYLQCQQR